jgi:hypothetical protein
MLAKVFRCAFGQRRCTFQHDIDATFVAIADDFEMLQSHIGQSRFYSRLIASRMRFGILGVEMKRGH